VEIYSEKVNLPKVFTAEVLTALIRKELGPEPSIGVEITKTGRL